MSSGKTLPTSAKPSTAHEGRPASDPARENRQMLVDMDDVGVRFGGDVALEGVSVCIHEGEFIGLVGPNGAGKTTLLRVLLGLLAPSSGEIARTAGVIGYVPQRGAVADLPVPMSVREVVALSQGDAAVIHWALDEVGMGDAGGRRFRELSGGQQQRVLIAKALAADPALLILDEPTTGIDEGAQRDFFAILERLAERNLTIVMVSHDVEAVMAQVDRVICLNRHILFDGPPEQFELESYLPAMYGTQHQVLHHHHELELGGKNDGDGHA